MEKVKFLRTKTLRRELVLCLSLDGTCKVCIAGVQGVLLMVLTSYEGMSTLSSHMVAGVLMVLTAHKEMSTLSSTVTHESPRVLYNHR